MAEFHPQATSCQVTGQCQVTSYNKYGRVTATVIKEGFDASWVRLGHQSVTAVLLDIDFLWSDHIV